MVIRALKWINVQTELTRIRIALNSLYVSSWKYELKPEFMWTKTEVEEVVELLEQAYELVRDERDLFRLVGDVDKMKVCDESLDDVNAEIWKLKQRLAA